MNNASKQALAPDKIAHTFFSAVFASGMALKMKEGRGRGCPMLPALALTLSLGLAKEWFDLNHRPTGWSNGDLLADFVGASIGAALSARCW